MKQSAVSHSYWIVVVAFLCLFISAGSGYYGFPIFSIPLETDFDWGRGTVSLAFSVFFLAQGLVSPFIGRLIDRYGAKRLITVGAFITGLGLLWLSTLQSLWSLYAAYTVVGIAVAGVGYIPSTQVVTDWFRSRRGLALGITTMGVGAGALVFAPIIGAFLIPTIGWRTTYQIMALLFWFIIIPAAWLVIKRRPPEAEFSSNTAAPADTKAETPATGEIWTLRMALKTSAFWFVAVAFMLANFSHTAAIMHQVNYVTDIGFSLPMASAALGALGFGSVVGKFTFGFVCDRLKAKYAAAISYVLQFIAILMLLSLKSTSSLALVWLYAIILGIGSGGWLPILSMLTSTNFGLASYGGIFGVAFLAQAVGTAAGPFIAGWMFDVMGTYSLFFTIILGVYVLALISMLASRRPKFPLPITNKKRRPVWI